MDWGGFVRGAKTAAESRRVADLTPHSVERGLRPRDGRRRPSLHLRSSSPCLWRPSPTRTLDWFWFGVAGCGYVGGGVVEGFAGFEGGLFVDRASFADGIVPAIVPGDVGFAID